MQIVNYKLETLIQYEENQIDELLVLCEEAVYHITTNERIRYKLKSALHELVINSLEHGYNKNLGKVSISIKNEQNCIVLVVADEGSGMQSSSIKSDFYLSSINSAQKRGWGLLMTAKLSGNISVAPNNPCGTIITISIPE
jgi:serine/threonine-protein kinase RsbW